MLTRSEIVLTEGPAEWFSLKGRNYGNYFPFTTNHFDVRFDSVIATLTGGSADKSSGRCLPEAARLAMWNFRSHNKTLAAQPFAEPPPASFKHSSSRNFPDSPR